MSKKNKISISDFYCAECGHKGMPLPRVGRTRENGHLKKIFCLNCQKETNHVEIKPNEASYRYVDFKEEYDLGRFVNGQRVEKKNLRKCNSYECRYNKNGLCWNANESFNCDERKEGK